MLAWFSDCRKFGRLNRFVPNQATVLFMKERFDRKIKTLTSSEHASSPSVSQNLTYILVRKNSSANLTYNKASILLVGSK